MTAKVIKLPALPPGLTVSVDVCNISTLAVLETVACTEAAGVYSGTITGAHAGQLLFLIKFSGAVASHRVRTIQDTAGPWVILTELETLETAGDGAYSFVATIDDGVDPIEGAVIRISNASFNVVRTADAAGDASFGLDAATYDVVITSPGFDPIVTTLVIVGNDSVTYSLTPTSITPPPSALFSTGVMLVYDELGELETGVDINMQMIAGPGVAGYALDTAVRTETSDGAGFVEFTGLRRGATYKVWRGAVSNTPGTTFALRTPASSNTFVVPDAASFNIVEVLGAE